MLFNLRAPYTNYADFNCRLLCIRNAQYNNRSLKNPYRFFTGIRNVCRSIKMSRLFIYRYSK